ncbi:MAG: hypothetical protein JW895_02850 [Thermoleophilaceae bacterium]|nr:hypothetical protein [Thermoleophilaceae bacterium]
MTVSSPDRLAFFNDLPRLTGAAFPDGAPEDIPAEEPKLTSTIQLGKTGRFRHPRYGDFTVSTSTFEAMVANFEKHVPMKELPVDYDHTPDLGGPTRACGWIKSIAVEGQKLMGEVEWTWSGAYSIKEGEYRFISPTWQMEYTDDEGNEHGPTLLACALTNRPFFEGMAVVQLAQNFSRDQLPAGFQLASEQPAVGQTFDAHWTEALAAGIRPEFRPLYEDKWRVNAHLRKTATGREFLLETGLLLQRLVWDDNEADEPTITLGRVSFAKPSGLTPVGEALADRIEAVGAEHGIRSFDAALARMAGRAAPPRAFATAVEDGAAGVDPKRAALARRAERIADDEQVGLDDALELAAFDVEIAELRADDGSSPVEWEDTSQPFSASPWNDEDWERDRRRAATVGMELTRESWEAHLARGGDPVFEFAKALRKRQVDPLERARETKLHAAQDQEGQRRREAIEKELERRTGR